MNIFSLPFCKGRGKGQTDPSRQQVRQHISELFKFFGPVHLFQPITQSHDISYLIENSGGMREGHCERNPHAEQMFTI